MPETSSGLVRDRGCWSWPLGRWDTEWACRPGGMISVRAVAPWLPDRVERLRHAAVVADGDRDRGVEILALRHQIAVLERRLGKQRVRFTPGDRAFLAALLHRLPTDVLERLRLLLRPDTVLRRHRDCWCWACRWRPPPSGRCYETPGLIRHPNAPAALGSTSCALKPTLCWPVTSWRP